MIKATALLAGLALLGGCSGMQQRLQLQPATPPDYTGPTANVADQVTQVNGELIHVFEVTQVDDRRLLSTSMATVRASQGHGFTAAPVALTNELPLRPARVHLQALTQYGTPMLALKGAACRAQRDVAFTPEAGKAYRVAGRVTAALCEAWIEDKATGQVVTDKVSAPGTGR